MSKEDLARIIPYRDDEVVVEVLADGDPMLLLNDLQEQFGISEIRIYGDKVQFWSPRSVIKQLDALGTVRNVGLLSLPVSYVGAATTQGDDSQRTDVVRSFQGLTGAGITVGVISASYNLSGNPISAATDISTGDLPGPGNPLGHTQPVTVYRDNRINSPFVPRSDEGRAMLQIVHDVAPGANLVFSNDAAAGSNVFPTEQAFAQNITALWQTQGADIIVDDLIYFTEPMFAEGPVAAAARQAVEAGITYVSAAGNQAAASYESAFRDSFQNVNVTFNGNTTTIRAHDFDPGAAIDILQRITVPANDVTLSFQWNQPFGAATTNFEIFVIDALNGVVVSRGTQLNPSNPVEVVSIDNPTTVARPFDILIGVNGALPAGPIDMKYVAFNSAVQINEFATNSPTAFGHVLANGVIGVGAAEFWQTPEFGVTPPVLASFSSLGGVDIVAPQRGNTTFFGEDVFEDADTLPNFGGTSAAAPHVAGIAALLLQTNPSLAPAGVLAALAESAIDMDSPFTTGFDIGFDAGTGSGLVDSLGALGRVIDAPQLVGLDPNEYITVNVTTDATDTNPDPNIIDVSPANGNQVSLRAAVVNANLSTSTQKTILVPSGTYNLTLSGTGGDIQGDLDITRAMSIIGAGAGRAIINASSLPTMNRDRIFEVATSGASLNAARLTLTGGKVTAGTDGGGAILAKAGTTVDLSQVSLVSNASNTFGGAIRIAETLTTLRVRNSVITGNTADGSGGGIAAYTPGAASSNVTMAGTILAKNTHTGGTYHNFFSDSFFINEGYNLVDDNTGSYFQTARGDHIGSIGSVDYVVTGLADTYDGLTDQVVMSVRDAIRQGNVNPGSEIWIPGWHFVLTIIGPGGVPQGDLDTITPMSIRGVAAGQTVIDAGGFSRNNEDRVFEVLAGALSVSRVTLTGGKVRGNEVHGGAIMVRDGGTLHLAESAIVRNETLGPFGNGGGIYFEEEAGGSITDSVITGNKAVHLCGGVMLAAQQGGSPAKVTLARTIVVNNKASAASGPAIDILAGFISQPARAFTSGAYNRLGNATTGFANGVNGDYIKPTGLNVHYVVTRMADSYNHVDDPVALSLRDAIDSAETTAGAQEIWVPAWRLLMTMGGTGAISQGDFDIATEMTIRGIGPGATIIDAGPLADRIFDVASTGVLGVSQVTLALGEAPTRTFEWHGGAIRVQNEGELNLDHIAAVGNLATHSGDGGAIYFAATGHGSITNSVITVNESEDYTGGVYLAPSSPGAGGIVTVANSIIANNTDGAGAGSDVFAGLNRTFTSGGRNRLGNATTGFVHNPDPESAGDYIGTPDYIVTSVIDTYDGSSDPLMMSLRDAIHQANETIGTQKIWLPAWAFILTLERDTSMHSTDTKLEIGDLDIKDSLEILGVHDSTSVKWLTTAVADEVFELVGDYNLNGTVDTADGVVWQAGGMASDGDDDGVTGGDQGDYDAWADHYGNTFSVSGVA